LLHKHLTPAPCNTVCLRIRRSQVKVLPSAKETPRLLSEDEREAIRRLAKDIPGLWSADHL
jgi:hypothetical protein